MRQTEDTTDTSDRTIEEKYNELHANYTSLQSKYKKLKQYVKENRNIYSGGNGPLILKNNYIKNLCNPYINNFISFLEDKKLIYFLLFFF